jgi:predicted dehydrogenase
MPMTMTGMADAASPPANRCRVALAGTGDRGTSMWARELLTGQGDRVDLVGLHDSNRMRLAAARGMLETAAPGYDELGRMLRELRPDKLMVCTRDDTHAEIIATALEAGVDVITEKPLTTSLQGCRRILDAERRSGRRVDVAFNYRCSPTAARIKQLLLDGAIGTVTSVDFHWYLDTRHGADYFRRWHSTARHSGSLFVHKATHHFDLLAWYLDSAPAEVFAKAERRRYGDAGPFRGRVCRDCPHARECAFHIDIRANPRFEQLYVGPETEDGYARDACVFREEIDIPDTMAALITTENRVMVSYSLNAYLPVEGHAIAFNGIGGRLELRQ